MSTIWKHPLGIVDSQTIHIPSDSKILCVRVQNEQPCVWFRCEPQYPKCHRKLIIRGTGHEDIPDAGYIGSFMLHNGALVFHVFDGGES